MNKPVVYTVIRVEEQNCFVCDCKRIVSSVQVEAADGLGNRISVTTAPCEWNVGDMFEVLLKRVEG